MRTGWRQQIDGLLSPLSLAAYAAWLAVWLGSHPASGSTVLTAWILHAALIGFLLLFVIEHLLSGRVGRTGELAIDAGLAIFALVAITLTPHGPAPILLVLLSAVIAAQWPPRTLMVALVTVNLAFAAVILTTWPGSTSHRFIYICAYISFQVFAALVMRYAAQAQDMSERLRATNADLLATRELLAEGARDAERLRVARELHDIAGHKLTALKINLTALERDPRFAQAPQPALCRQLADELLGDIRGLVARTRQDDHLDLRDALAALATPFPRPRSHVEITDGVRVTSLTQAGIVLRTAQEALTNSARHSQASNLWLVLDRDDRGLRLDIRDDGRGVGAPRPGNGLTGMRERLEAAGGSLRVQRTETGGVWLQAWLPDPS